jgi:S1-C subfamily serine protease
LDHEAGGTGFFIDDRGTIATNHHVIDGTDHVRIKLIDGTILDQVELLTSDPEVDLALLRVDPAKLTGSPKPVVLGDSAAVTVGEPVMVIGNPLGLEHTLSDGLVSSRRVYEGKKYIQMSAPTSPGNSGGPVFDRHAKVIGVAVAGFPWGENLNLAVPVAELAAMVKSDYPGRRRFGSSTW